MLRSFEVRHEDSIFGFLKVLAANVVHDHFKAALAAKRGAGVSAHSSSDLETSPGKDDSFSAVAERLQLERIDRILNELTAGKDQERKRAIFWLRHRQGFTAGEIAALPAIGLTTEGVESVLLRLSVMIRNHFGFGKSAMAWHPAQMRSERCHHKALAEAKVSSPPMV